MALALAALLKVFGLKNCGIPQPKPKDRFSRNFQVMFNPRGSKTD